LNEKDKLAVGLILVALLAGAGLFGTWRGCSALKEAEDEKAALRIEAATANANKLSAERKLKRAQLMSGPTTRIVEVVREVERQDPGDSEGPGWLGEQQESVWLEAGQPAPFPGLLMPKDTAAKAAADMSQVAKLEGENAGLLGQMKELDRKRLRAESKARGWRIGGFAVGLVGLTAAAVEALLD
jgi:hypothetical protein